MTYFHPERMPELPARRRKAARLQLEQVVAKSGLARSRHRPAAIAVAMAAVILSTGAAAAGVVAYHAITDHTQARCFAVANAHAASNFFTTIAEASKPASKADVGKALAICRALFQIGELKKGHPVMRPPWKRARHVPRLVACVWPDGTAAIFPGGRGTCRKLDLQTAAGR